MNLRQRAAGRLIKRFVRRRAGGLRRAGYKRRAIYRSIATINPTPTFTETYFVPQAPTILGNAGGNFSVSISQVPQIAQYSNLYRQYRINWVKVMLFPELSGDSVDVNSIYMQNAVGGNAAGKPRIAYAINDTPNLPVPLAESDVLTDNGCKVKTLGSKWSVSFKPCVDATVSAAGVGVRQRLQPWLSFAAAGQVDPQHYGVSYWITHYQAAGAVQTFRVYYKVNFSLRDAN